MNVESSFIVMDPTTSSVYDSLNCQIKKIAFKARILAAIRDGLAAGECTVAEAERLLDYKI